MKISATDYDWLVKLRNAGVLDFPYQSALQHVLFAIEAEREAETRRRAAILAGAVTEGDPGGEVRLIGHTCGKIDAIRAVRRATLWGLKEAKELVDQLDAGVMPVLHLHSNGTAELRAVQLHEMRAAGLLLTIKPSTPEGTDTTGEGA